MRIPPCRASRRGRPRTSDVGCRNTVFGAQAQEASRRLELWRTVGLHQFRLEFAHESGEQVARIAQAFEEVLAGRATSRQLAQHLQRWAPQGITEGSLFVQIQ